MFGTILATVLSFASPYSAVIVGIAKQINWKIAAPCIVAVGMLGFAYYKGYSEAQQAYIAQGLAQQVAELKAETIKLNNARVDAEKKSMDIDAANLQLQHKVSEYVASVENSSRKDGACRLSRADLSKLRNLAN
jgi:Tfp pilus assembly protein PilV